MSVYRLADVVPIALRRFSSQVGHAFALSSSSQPPATPSPGAAVSAKQRLYITTEICRQPCDLQTPSAPLSHHIYVSLLNTRAEELAADLCAHAMRMCPSCALTITQRPEEMVRSSQFLLLLSEETFSDPSRAEEIGFEVAMAVEAGLVRRPSPPHPSAARPPPPRPPPVAPGACGTRHSGPSLLVAMASRGEA